MTDKQRSICIAEATNYTDRDAYISDLSMSYIWGDDPEATVHQERFEKLKSIYDACHRSVKEIASASGLSKRKLAERFCIPQRTIDSWGSNAESGRQCPLYTRLMMQELLGLFQR